MIQDCERAIQSADADGYRTVRRMIQDCERAIQSADADGYRTVRRNDTDL